VPHVKIAKSYDNVLSRQPKVNEVKIVLPFLSIHPQVKSCLRCKYSAVKHISIDKAWNKQHRLGERQLKQSLTEAQQTKFYAHTMRESQVNRSKKVKINY